METSFAEQLQFFIKRRNLPIEQLANLANLSRKTLYRWVKGEIVQPRHWYQVVALGKALRLNLDEVNRLLWVTKNPSFQELKDLARFEYELELLDEFSAMKPAESPVPRPQTRFETWAVLESPTGAMRPESPYYIERAADEQLRHQLAGHGTTTTIQAGRQTGKTSLLSHAIHAVQGETVKVVYLDFQLADSASLDSLPAFLRYLSESVAEQLEVDWEIVDSYWKSARNPAQTFNRFIEREVLQPAGRRVLLAIDEADILLEADYKKHFFALLRAWDSRRAFDANWRRLNLVLVISTHPYLLIDDVNLSPFNVGLNIHLKDFSADQVAELNMRHGNPLKRQEIPVLMELVGGQPYLVRQAFYTLVSEKISLDELSTAAVSPDGPFGRHLTFYQHSLKKKPALLGALQQVIREQNPPEETFLERLSAVGLIRQEKGAWKPRCGIYASYFRR